MKKIFILATVIMLSRVSFGQEVVNVILVGNNGVTENIKEATSFIIIKRFPNSFQRLDYNLGRPLERERNYSDSTLKILHGSYYEYSFNGSLSVSGYYMDNAKEKSWYQYDDTGKVILELQYEKGVLVKTIDPDTVKKEPQSDKLKDGEIEAHFKKGDRDWIEYLMKNLDANVAEKSVRGGKVRVGFVVDTSGKCVDIHLRRSVEFILDDEAIRLIQSSPLWHPAIQDGRKVKAYRIQPISFAKEE